MVHFERLHIPRCVLKHLCVLFLKCLTTTVSHLYDGNTALIFIHAVYHSTQTFLTSGSMRKVTHLVCIHSLNIWVAKKRVNFPFFDTHLFITSMCLVSVLETGHIFIVI